VKFGRAWIATATTASAVALLAPAAVAQVPSIELPAVPDVAAQVPQIPAAAPSSAISDQYQAIADQVQKAAPPVPAPQPAVAPKPAPAPKPAAAPAAKPAPAPTTAAASSPKATPEVPARWWGDPKEQDPRKLNLTYVGQAAGGKGIALLFTGTFASPGVANWIKVTDTNGKPAAGHWELGTSPKMLVYKGMNPGRYFVVLAPDLKDAQGKVLGRKLAGAVTVQ